MVNTSIDKYLKSSEYKLQVSGIAERIVNLSATADNEATIESNFDCELFSFFKENISIYGIDFSLTKEKALDTGRVIKGRADSAINNFVIEFKQPRTLSSKRQKDKAIRQIGDYLKSIANMGSGVAKGFVTDGTKGAFVTLYGSELKSEEFYGLTGATLDTIIRIIIDVNLSALNSDNLVRYLCNPPSNDGIGFRLARDLMSLAKGRRQPKTEMLFGEWKELFKLAHDDASKQKAIEDRKRSLGVLFGDSFDDNDEEYMALFCLQTAYAIIIKTLAFKIVCRERFHEDLLDFFAVAELDSESLRRYLQQLEDGTVFKQYGIINLLEGDFFSWYVNESQWSSRIADDIKELYTVLSRFSGSPVISDYVKCQDFFKDLYQSMIPGAVRHSLGEYYTRKWLANEVISEGVDWLPRGWRALDPCCGSGTFLTALIDYVLGECAGCPNDVKLKQVLNRVKGIDLNPVAVLTARVNYFINISNLIDDDTDIEIPVYLGDSSYVPKEVLVDNVKCIDYTISTIKTPIHITVPVSMISDSQLFSKTMNDIEIDIKSLDPDSVYEKLIKLCAEEELLESIRGQIMQLARQLVDLERQKWNGVWAKIISNYLNTINLGKFELVVGNPPWVDWKTLPSGYREKIKALCISRRLFSGDVLTGGINLNICALITNVVAQHWLSDGGLLAFLMPEPLLFQQSYEGFRNLYIEDDKRLYIQKVVNWNSAGHPFSPVTQKFLTYYISSNAVDYRKGVPAKFVIKKTKKNIDELETLVPDETFRYEDRLVGTCNSDRNFFTYANSAEELDEYKRIGGENELYKGREGIEFYPQELLIFRKSSMPDKGRSISLENIQNGKSKYKVARGNNLLESEFLRPMIKGKDITPFNARYDGYIVPFPYEAANPQLPIGFRELKASAPKLAEYYYNNKSLFDSQTSYNENIIGKADAEFYALARVGAYSFSECAVVFRDNTKWAAAVVTPIETGWGGRKMPVFQNHAASISTDKEGRFISLNEAHYICGIMNSSIIYNYMMFSTDSRSFPIRLRFRVPKYDQANPYHNAIRRLSQIAHAVSGAKDRIETISARLSNIYMEMLGDCPEDNEKRL